MLRFDGIYNSASLLNKFIIQRLGLVELTSALSIGLLL